MLLISIAKLGCMVVRGQQEDSVVVEFNYM